MNSWNLGSQYFGGRRGCDGVKFSFYPLKPFTIIFEIHISVRFHLWSIFHCILMNSCELGPLFFTGGIESSNLENSPSKSTSIILEVVIPSDFIWYASHCNLINSWNLANCQFIALKPIPMILECINPLDFIYNMPHIEIWRIPKIRRPLNFGGDKFKIFLKFVSIQDSNPSYSISWKFQLSVIIGT